MKTNMAVGKNTLHMCDDCGEIFREHRLLPAENLAMRLDPGGTVPSGECPHCYALAYPLEPAGRMKTIQDVAEVGIEMSLLKKSTLQVKLRAAREALRRIKRIVESDE